MAKTAEELKLAKRLRAQARRAAKKSARETSIKDLAADLAAAVKGSRADAKAARRALPELCIIEGRVIRQGDWVCFKDDIEMSGRAHSISGMWLTLTSKDSTTGEELTHIANVKNCWVE